jgi:hypothetical protein
MFLSRISAVGVNALALVQVAIAQVSTVCQPLTGEPKYMHLVIIKLILLRDLS